MDAMPWFGWIAIAGITAWALVTLATTLVGPRKKENEALQDALRANAESQAQTAAALAAIEQRLSSVEKTLTDIP